MDLHHFLVLLSKTFGLFWMMGFFLLVVWLAYRPSARRRHERAAASILDNDLAAGGGQ